MSGKDGFSRVERDGRVTHVLVPVEEFERMTRYGSVTPDLWMVNATGSPISAAPLLHAAERALAAE